MDNCSVSTYTVKLMRKQKKKPKLQELICKDLQRLVHAILQEPRKGTMKMYMIIGVRRETASYDNVDILSKLQPSRRMAIVPATFTCSSRKTNQMKTDPRNKMQLHKEA